MTTEQKQSPSGEDREPDVNLKNHFKQMERRFQIGLLLAFLIPLVSLSAYFHFQFNVSLEEVGKLNLVAIAESQRNTVELFLHERLVNLFALFRSAEFSLNHSQTNVDRMLLQLQKSSDTFIDIGLLDQKGIQVGYSGPFPFLQSLDYSGQSWFKQLMEPERNHIITDIYLGFRKKPHFTIGAKQTIAGQPYIIRATLDPHKFSYFLQSITRGKGLEAFIINHEGQLQLADPDEEISPENAAYTPPSGNTSGADVVDLNGRQVLVSHATFSEVPWVLIIKQPLSHAYAQVYRARRVMLFSTTVILIAVVVTVWSAIHRLAGKAMTNAFKRDELQGQLLHASRLASIGELSTGVAHEINNPLAIIVATSGVIKDMLNPQFHMDATFEQILVELNIIDTAAFRAQGITQKLLDYGRKQAPSLALTDLNAIMEDVGGGLKERTLSMDNIEVVRDLDPALPTVWVDPDQIRQVFVNLISNAGDAIEEAGTITISTRRTDGEVCITVRDTGKGMDSETIKKIFNPFFTTKPVGKGTGLGLSVSVGIVETMGGRIEVQSLPGVGSAFSVFLPVQHYEKEKIA